MTLITNKQREDFKEIGRQFAYEGLDESYLKEATPEEIQEFRKGFDEAKREINVPSSRTDDLFLDNDSRSMHR